MSINGVKVCRVGLTSNRIRVDISRVMQDSNVDNDTESPQKHGSMKHSLDVGFILLSKITSLFLDLILKVTSSIFKIFNSKHFFFYSLDSFFHTEPADRRTFMFSPRRIIIYLCL